MWTPISRLHTNGDDGNVKPNAPVSQTNLHGPPGTGKTTLLTQLFIDAAQVYGPRRVGAVTYTRAAAQELKERVAKALGLRTDYATLNRELPYVGTIHALCFKMLGLSKARIAGEHLAEFCASVSIDMPEGYRETNPEYAEAYWWGDQISALEADTLFRTVGMAAHMMISVEEAFERTPLRGQMVSDVGRIKHLVAEYAMWKRENDYLDFEDLLVEGARVPLPVKMLMLDEAQDSSALMFACVDGWAHSGTVKRYVVAGDEFQAIYSYMGGAPELFMRQPGKHRHLPVSHRLSPAAADFAVKVLQAGGWNRALEFYRGEGGEGVGDGSTFYLARTHALATMFETDLQQQGTPYGYLRGLSPLESKAGDAYRAMLRLESEGMIEGPQLKAVIERLPRGFVPYGLVAKVARMRGPTGWPSEMPQPPAETRKYLPYSDYFNRVISQHGEQAMFKKPLVRCGTVHGSKGREADVVYLADSWARLPAKAMMADEEGQRSEALVAYVSCTRHRKELHLVDGFPGVPYQFP